MGDMDEATWKSKQNNQQVEKNNTFWTPNFSFKDIGQMTQGNDGLPVDSPKPKTQQVEKKGNIFDIPDNIKQDIKSGAMQEGNDSFDVKKTAKNYSENTTTKTQQEPIDYNPKAQDVFAGDTWRGQGEGMDKSSTKEGTNDGKSITEKTNDFKQKVQDSVAEQSNQSGGGLSGGSSGGMVSFEDGIGGQDVFESFAYTENYIRPAAQQIQVQEKIREVDSKMPTYIEAVQSILNKVENYGGVFTDDAQRQSMEEVYTRLRNFNERIYRIASHPIAEWVEYYNRNMDAANCWKAFHELDDLTKEGFDVANRYFEEHQEKYINYMERAYRGDTVDSELLEWAEEEKEKCDAAIQVMNEINAHLPEYSAEMETFDSVNRDLYGLTGTADGHKVVDWGRVRAKGEEIYQYRRTGETYP